MNYQEALQGWGRVLTGRPPSLSIEITRECPLRCPGCYAYEEGHVGNGVSLRQLTDSKGSELVEGVLRLVDTYRPLHLSIVGGDPLVRYRELEALLPQLSQRGVFVQVVTSAFRPIPAAWSKMKRVNVAVSVDGLQPEHDERRKPATYERILKNIAGHRVIIHCAVTAQMMGRASYLEEFMWFWSGREEVKKIWVSLFTPQRGANPPECLSAKQRAQVIEELLRLRVVYPKLKMGEATIREFAAPPKSPRECLFARTTHVLSADLKTRVTPCQLGGDPDCLRCGCMASMGLAAVAHTKVLAGVTVGQIYDASARVGQVMSRLRGAVAAAMNGVSPGEQGGARQKGDGLQPSS